MYPVQNSNPPPPKLLNGGPLSTIVDAKNNDTFVNYNRSTRLMRHFRLLKVVKLFGKASLKYAQYIKEEASN